jgi:hypothetical protein
LKPLLWTQRLIGQLAAIGITEGWAFQDGHGRQMKMSNFEDRIFYMLLDIQEDKPSLIPLEIDGVDSFGLARSFR